ncbi:MAG: DUF302 domain-containing protein [Clostridium sp.]|jgi:uncharacterized protein (DUF302 family)|nr:DUF302 domain-containing protein [Clostridium sp.]
MNLIYEKQTNQSVSEAIKKLESTLKEKGFGILWQLNFKDKLEEKGLEFKEDFVVLEVCNPKLAKDVLDNNIHVGYILPCKMVVRSEGENTYVGMASPQVLIGLVSSELKELAKEVETTIKNAIEASI